MEKIAVPCTLTQINWIVIVNNKTDNISSMKLRVGIHYCSSKINTVFDYREILLFNFSLLGKYVLKIYLSN